MSSEPSSFASAASWHWTASSLPPKRKLRIVIGSPRSSEPSPLTSARMNEAAPARGAPIAARRARTTGRLRIADRLAMACISMRGPKGRGYVFRSVITATYSASRNRRSVRLAGSLRASRYRRAVPPAGFRVPLRGTLRRARRSLGHTSPYFRTGAPRPRMQVTCIEKPRDLPAESRRCRPPCIGTALHNSKIPTNLVGNAEMKHHRARA